MLSSRGFMNAFKIVLFLFFVCVAQKSLIATCPSCVENPPPLSPCKSATNFQLKACRLLIARSFGDYIALKKGSFEQGFFALAANERKTHLFVDGRAFQLPKNNWAGCLGIGCRLPVCGDKGIWGSNVYYDRLQTRVIQEEIPIGSDIRLIQLNKDFARVGLGAEFLSTFLDVRVNGYFPVGRKKFSSRPILSSSSEGDKTAYRYNVFFRKGIDGEIGRFLWRGSWASSYFALGGYCYHHRDLNALWGPRARLEFWLQAYASLQIAYTYDKEFHSRYQAKALFSVPLEQLFSGNFPKKAEEQKRYTQLVRRNYIPFIEQKRF